MYSIAADELQQFVTDLVVGMGASDTIGEAVASSLVAADLRGHASHGTMRVAFYRRMIDAGELVPDAVPVIAHDNNGVVVDGQSGYGQVAGRRAVGVLTDAVRDRGVAAVGVRNATHLGRIGEWAERTASHGFLFASFVNTQGGSATVAPPGSADRSLSTNPIAFGIPTFDALPFPIVLDMATSQVANGKIRERLARDEPVPDEWTITDAGDPVRDPEAFLAGEGAALPLGGRTAGYKGYGLAVVAELFAGIVSDGIVAGQRESDWPSNAAAFIGVDPLQFTTQDGVVERVRALARHLRAAERSTAVPLGPGAMPEAGCLPGEPEYRTAMDRLAEGIPVPDRVVTEFRDLAEILGLHGEIPRAFT